MQLKVFVLSQNGKPLMPTKRFGKVRRRLNNGLAKVIKREPFTIQLLYKTTEFTPPATLGIDSGYQQIGFSAVTEKEELIAGEVETLKGIPERNEARRMYRRNRRNQKRYRKSRFENRKKDFDWLAPSIQHKLDTHIRLVDQIQSILPVSHIIIEVANFDIQRIKKPDISRTEYQEGEQKGFSNTREYVLHRDGHQCQNPDCKRKRDILHVHHIDMNRANNHHSNLITLCHKCHTPANHKGFLKNWKPKRKPFKAETFMSTVRWRLVNQLDCEHTLGYLTKQNRFEFGIKKSHANDAFVIAGGTTQQRCVQFAIKQVRRNNRSLEYFYDATYIDARDRKKKKGAELFCGRTSRNKERNSENLRRYRLHKVKKGRRSIRKTRHRFQVGDLVRYEQNLYHVAGSQNLGTYVRLKELKKAVSVKKIERVKYGKGLCWEKTAFIPD
jgi:hypothetical protein